MIKIRLKLRATEDIPHTAWKKGEVCEFINSIFDKQNGIAYFPLDKLWDIEGYELLENDSNN